VQRSRYGIVKQIDPIAFEWLSMPAIERTVSELLGTETLCCLIQDVVIDPGFPREAGIADPFGSRAHIRDLAST
jgi:hypothetical protein